MLKGISLVLATVTMTLGIYSHYMSEWRSLDVTFGSGSRTVKPHELCQGGKWGDGSKCPDIGMEEYFVAMIIFSFVWSAATLVISALLKRKEDLRITYFDGAVHVLMGIILLIGAILFMISAAQIQNLFLLVQDTSGYRTIATLSGTKFIVAGLAIVQSLLYTVIALVEVRKGRSNYAYYYYTKN